MGAGYGSLFEYCVKKLGYSEAAAFLRVRAARAVLRFPRVLDDLRSGKIHLDAIMRLYPHLNDDNCERILNQASGATKREVMILAASLAPPAPAPERDIIRPLPRALPIGTPSPHAAPLPHPSAPLPHPSAPPPHPSAPPPHPSAPPPPPIERSGMSKPEIIPPAARVRLAFTADDEFMLLLDRWRGLRRHKFPAGRLEDLFEDALKLAIERVDPARPRRASRSGGAKGRRIPAAVKRAVWSRDGGRCAFIGQDGRRCEAAERLEYDHVRPWSLGGASTADNLRLLCRPHNQWLGRRLFGDRRRRAPLRPDAPAHAPPQPSP